MSSLTYQFWVSVKFLRDIDQVCQSPSRRLSRMVIRPAVHGVSALIIFEGLYLAGLGHVFSTEVSRVSLVNEAMGIQLPPTMKGFGANSDAHPQNNGQPNLLRGMEFNSTENAL
jgi:hypothetical protein